MLLSMEKDEVGEWRLQVLKRKEEVSTLLFFV